MDKLKISVIIPTYNRTESLANTIRSLKQQVFIGYEIIVVDNSCTDETKILVEKEERDIDKNRCFIMYLPEPSIGLHNARHTGAKASKGEILLYVDDDIIADENLLNEILKPYADPVVGCVGGKILPKWEVNPPEWIKLFSLSWLSILDLGEEIKETEVLYGCNFSIRRQILFDIGGFNPDGFPDRKYWYFRGDGEMGLLRKLHTSGRKIVYNPNAIVWHIIPKQRIDIKYFQERAFKCGVERSFSQLRYRKNISRQILVLRTSIFFYYIPFIKLLHV